MLTYLEKYSNYVPKNQTIKTYTNINNLTFHLLPSSYVHSLQLLLHCFPTSTKMRLQFTIFFCLFGLSAVWARYNIHDIFARDALAETNADELADALFVRELDYLTARDALAEAKVDVSGKYYQYLPRSSNIDLQYARFTKRELTRFRYPRTFR